MTDELRRKMVQRRREDVERLKPLEGHAAPLFALVSDTESSKRIRAQALTDLTECEPADAEPYLVAIFEADDAYMRVKVVLFTLRKGYRAARYPILTAKRSEVIRAELLRGGRSVSTKRMLIKALTRYQRSEFEREALEALLNASGHLRREILAYLEALGTMVSVRALEERHGHSRFGFKRRNEEIQGIIDTIRTRELARQGAVTLASASGGSVSITPDT